MFYSNFKEREKFREELAKANKKILELLNNISLTLSKDLHPVKKDTYHFLTDILYPDTRVEKTLYASMISVMQKSEFKSAGSSYLALLFSSYLIQELLKNPDLLNKNETELNEQSDLAFEKIRLAIGNNSKIIKPKQLYDQLDSILENPELATALKEAFDLAGLEGKINVENSQQDHYMVEMKSGYNFTVNPFKFFLTNNLWQEHDVKVLIVDGLIEKISELNTILNKSLESKRPMVIVAHGFSEEVVATLKANRDHNVLNILPVRLFSDLESLNVVNDIAVTCGSDVVSCVKGEQVQFIDYDSLPIVQKVKCTINELIIENASTSANVASHIKTLLKKRQDNRAVEDICNLLDGRIKSLFSHAVTIHLPNMTSTERDSTRVKLDIALRSSKTLLNNGMINLDDVLSDLSSQSSRTIFDNIFLSVLKKTGEKMESKDVPTLSLFLSVFFSIKTILMLLTSKGFIERLEN